MYILSVCIYREALRVHLEACPCMGSSSEGEARERQLIREMVCMCTAAVISIHLLCVV